MSKTQRRTIWLTWLVVICISFPLMYTVDPPKNDSIPSILTVGIVFMITALFSFKVKGTDIIVLQGIGLAAFLIFGLFLEALMTQFGILVYLMTRRIGKNEMYRIPVNSLMFLAVSVAAASVYYRLGGRTEEIGHNLLTVNLIPVFGFYLASYVVNEIFIYSYRRWFLPKTGKVKVIDRDTIWEIVATFLMMPLGIAFYYMYSIRGLPGMFIIAVPMVALSIVIRVINSSQELVRFLQKVNHLGQKLTEELSAKHVLDLFFERVPEMIPVDYLYIVSYIQPDKPKIVRLYRRDNGRTFIPFQKEADISLHVYREGKPVMGQRNKSRYPFLYALSEGKARSFLSVPMMYHGQVIGVLTLASDMNKAYSKSNRIGMEIIGDFLAIALENARNFEIRKKESERCPLTDLYNYRYLMRALTRIFSDPAAAVFSIIMLDVDNFKGVNDTYGHQSGNAILIGVADRLRQTVGDKGIIARYGGEEFTVVLPGMDRNLCFAMAESIRQAVASEPFMIYIENEHRYKQIYITISLGTSTAPFDAKDPTELIYNADHAMYTGAKRMGKNRVARFV
ncbi:sensor domain-containing diguanylate cyclase [Sporolactobacillus putidus]|uniref:GGDEF domain-containing protein n=1 Tax=Sporolactobacillus putidus TaxID=492735 RepID=A0A917RWK9_9BACL|nr:sensor domain-containing diguanylate cyclase [Sporolactobacillus putidus]GGL41294.1 hypothetical protein GCM10007968_01450 [Sporolactobacillus putidus]